MRALLRELKAILEHEASLHGSMVPISDDEPRSKHEGEAGDGSGADADATANAESGDRTRAASVEEDGEPSISAGAESSADEPSAAESATDGPDGASDDDDVDDDDVAADDLPAPKTTADAGDASDTSPPTPTDSSASDASMPNFDLFGNEVDPAEDPSLPPHERIEGLIPDDAPYKDLDTLEDLEQWVAENPLVPIDEDRENPVFGVGDPNAGLLIIGEAPGRDEDKQGEPFVGRAGKLLDKILDAIEFTREDVYIANILKSRPPRNRDPHDEEVEAHIPILYKQIALIQPEIILCVGKVAGNTMLDRRSSLKNLRGKEHDFYGIPLYVTYHPAALLRNSNWKRPTWEDVKLVRTRYDELTGAS